MNLYKILIYFISFFILFSLISNFLISIFENNLFAFLSFRNLFLILFLVSLIKENKLLLLALIFINLLFWYYFFITKSEVSYLSNPITNYTISIFNFFEILKKSSFIKNLIIKLPLIFNFLILVFIIPYKIKILKEQL